MNIKSTSIFQSLDFSWRIPTSRSHIKAERVTVISFNILQTNETWMNSPSDDVTKVQITPIELDLSKEQIKMLVITIDHFSDILLHLGLFFWTTI